jgi:hypothetical protein
MDSQTLLSTLLDLAQGIGIVVRPMPGSMETGSQGGSLVRLKGKEMFFLDESAPVADQIAALADVLKDRPELKDRFLPPEVREALEKP